MSSQPRRIRLKPWLLAQVNSGRYPGLQWLTPDHRLFQIPWRHATRHLALSEVEDNTIFKAWALETGKYQEGVDEPDPAKWKANLRCALNKSREFKLRYDGTKETPVQPYKIYEVCEQPANGDTVDEDDEEMPNLVGLTINPGSFPSHPEAARYSPAHLVLMPRLHDAMQTEPLPATSDLPRSDYPAAPGVGSGGGVIMEQGDFVHRGGGGGGGRLSADGRLGVIPPASATGALPPPGPPLVASGTPPGPAPMDHSPMPGVQTQGEAQPFKYDLLSSLPLTDLDLKFQYRGRTVDSLTVSNPQGCRLYYGHLEPTPDQVELFGPVTLQQVRFPDAAGVQNQKQRFYTEALLDVMDRGLILEIWEQDIYAVRLCQCKVFWSGPGGMGEQGPPNPMEREKKIRVFSLNDFLQGLIFFQKGEAHRPPPFEICFCFGEDWPDTKPKEKKLIIVQVVPVAARILTEMFSGELSWSLDSIRLQISHPDVKDHTVEQFKELQRLLQTQHIQGPWGALNGP